MRAAVYARKSNEQEGRDEDTKPVTRQVERAREFAAKKSWTIADEHVYVDDAVSGAEWDGRTGWSALKRAAGVGDKNARPAFDVLIVANQSRIGRDAQRVPYEILQVEDCDVAIWSYLDNRRISVADAGGEIEVAIKGIADSFQRRQASQWALDELRRRARDGYVAGGKIYGYKNVRAPDKAKVQRVVDGEQAKVVRKVFELTADGWGYARIARHLNDLKIPGPRTLGKPEQVKLLGRGETVKPPKWSPSGVRELIRRHELYSTGTYVWGQSRRSRKKGSKARLRRDAGDATIVKVQRDEWIIVAADLARRALARIEAYNAKILRSGVGVGKERTRFVGQLEPRGSYLLSGLVRCGARLPSGKTCNAPMTVGTRGRRGLKHYACSSFKENKGCTSKGAVLMSRLDEAVIASLRTTFTEEAFKEYLAEQAKNKAKVSEDSANRERLEREELPRLAKVVERLTRRLGQVDDDAVADVIQAELKAAVQERKDVQTQIAALREHAAALEDQDAEVERLRAAWGGWAGALEDGTREPELVVRARQVLKLILATPVWIYAVEGADGKRSWRFVGVAKYDRVLDGGVGQDVYDVGFRNIVDPDQGLIWFAEAVDVPAGSAPRPAGSESEHHFVDDQGNRVIIRYGGRQPPPISGGSGGVDEGSSTSRPPVMSYRPRSESSTREPGSR